MACGNLELFNAERLQFPDGRTAASGSDLVIFSCRDRSLPSVVRDWTESCLVRPLLPAALVALLAISPSAEGEADGAGKHLADAAHRSGMRLFSTRYSLGERQQRDVLRTVGKYDSNK